MDVCTKVKLKIQFFGKTKDMFKGGYSETAQKSTPIQITYS